MTNQPKRMGYTSTDFTNALLYAEMRLLYEKTKKNPTNVLEWQNINDDGTIPYFCPPGLKNCYYGFPKIKDSGECTKQNTYKISSDPNTDKPGYKNGWYLKWNANNNNCYKSNYLFAYECNHNFDNSLKKDGLLKYNSDTEQCNITKEYCDAYGYLEYNEGTAPNYSDRSCEMTTGQTVADALFGNTIGRGILGGACF